MVWQPPNYLLWGSMRFSLLHLIFVVTIVTHLYGSRDSGCKHLSGFPEGGLANFRCYTPIFVVTLNVYTHIQYKNRFCEFPRGGGGDTKKPTVTIVTSKIGV